MVNQHRDILDILIATADDDERGRAEVEAFESLKVFFGGKSMKQIRRAKKRARRKNDSNWQAYL